MKYVVDRIIDGVAVLECTHDKTKIEVEVSLFPFKVYEGCVLVKSGDKFLLDKRAEDARRESILEKFNRAKAGKQNG